MGFNSYNSKTTNICRIGKAPVANIVEPDPSNRIAEGLGLFNDIYRTILSIFTN